jgi:anti-sigma-K factor RskA
MKLRDPELQSRLAAEYVLGTMKGRARRRFQEYMARDRALADAVARWEAHLTPLAEKLDPIAPPDRVWKAIEARAFGGKQAEWLGGKAKAETPASTRPFSHAAAGGDASAVLEKLKFWKRFGVGVSAFASALLITLFAGYALKPPANPMMMAVLEEQGVARIAIEQPKSGVLLVNMVKPWKAEPNMSLQLWVIDKDGKAQSLGLVNDTGETKFVSRKVDPMLKDGMVLALSKEPRGGSPTGQPTGMTLCKGAIAKMPPKRDQPQI